MATTQEIIDSLAAAGVTFPLKVHAEDKATVVDSSGADVFVVDHNGERADEDAWQIAADLTDLINLAAGSS
jgi:hypothetical protein